MSREALVFRVATAAATLHALDDAFGHLGHGVGPGRHALAAAVSVAAAAAGVAGFGRLRPGLRAALALSFGMPAVANGVLHVRFMAAHGVSAAHVTGVLALAAGVALIALAAAIPWRRRGQGRARARVIAPIALAVGSFLVLGPLTLAVVDAHRFREPVGPPPDTSYRTVEFTAPDGVRLAGWYRPTRNGATVVVLHGGGSDRTGSVAHARMLARHGYGVLLYDARGSGESDGNQSSYGWGWDRDLAGALEFLERRPEVDAHRIGGLGLSTGADVLLDVAAERQDLRAVVTDGAAAGSFEDWKRLRGVELGLPPGWVMFKAIEVLTGAHPAGRALADQVPRIAAPVLLVSAGAELEFGDLYARLGSPRVEHWRLPHGHHTATIRERPQEYERRVVGFLDRAL